MKQPSLVLFGILLIGAVILAGCVTPPVEDGTVHKHADFALFINGQQFNFAQEKYMTDLNGNMLSELVHLHDMDGNVIHVHAPGITLGMFFESIGMKLETTTTESGMQEITFTDDEGNAYTYTRFGCYEYEPGQSICADPIITAQTWRLFVNGEPLAEDMKIEDYLLEDLDQIVLTNASFDQNIDGQLSSVTDKACIQSETCPERGEPSEGDSCTGSSECGTGTIPTV